MKKIKNTAQIKDKPQIKNKPQVGETWATSGGDQYTIIQIKDFEKHAIVAIDRKKRMTTFTENGSFLEDNYPHPFDLIAKV